MRWSRGRRAIAHSQVDAITVEVDDAIVRGNEDVDGGMPGAKARQPRHQPKRSERQIGRHGQRPGRLFAANLGHGLRDFVEHRPGRDLQDLSRVGQAQLPVTAFEQRRAELFLERLDLARERRLGQEQLLGPPREREMARRSIEPLEQVQRRQARQGNGSFSHSVYACERCGEFV